MGDKIARLIGAGPGEVIAADSTSLNLYKVLSVALALVEADAPWRKLIVSERDNFPTDLYMAESLARQHGFELCLVLAEDIAAHLHESTAVLMLMLGIPDRANRLKDRANAAFVGVIGARARVVRVLGARPS